MNAIPLIRRSNLVFVIRHRWARMMVGLLTLCPVARGSDDTPPGPSDHAIFIGVQLSYQNKVEQGLVDGVESGSVSFVVDGAHREVGMSAVRAGLNIKRVPRVSATTVSIDGFKGVRGFSAARNPVAMAMRQQVIMANLAADQREVADGKLFGAEAALPSKQGQTLSDVRQSGRDEAVQKMDATYATTNGEIFNPASSMQNSQSRSNDNACDAYEITFEISSPVAVENAYGAMVIIVHVPDVPGQLATAVKLQKLPTIGTKPRKLRWIESGLPRGFAVERCELHVFSGGQEIATNLSERRVDVTRGEAHQFLLLQYLQVNQGATIAPEIVLDLVPGDFRSRVGLDQRQSVAHLKIDQNGNVIEAFIAGTDPQEAESPLVSTLREMCFYPALRNGAPSESEASFALSEFVP